tara:strand:+ start:106 stop:330 length:225 start_codon:yes stop_codon:yes gene_type:complete
MDSKLQRDMDIHTISRHIHYTSSDLERLVEARKQIYLKDNYDIGKSNYNSSLEWDKFQEWMKEFIIKRDINEIE